MKKADLFQIIANNLYNKILYRILQNHRILARKSNTAILNNLMKIFLNIFKKIKVYKLLKLILKQIKYSQKKVQLIILKLKTILLTKM
jgi:hypothetical protein